LEARGKDRREAGQNVLPALELDRDLLAELAGAGQEDARGTSGERSAEGAGKKHDRPMPGRRSAVANRFRP